MPKVVEVKRDCPACQKPMEKGSDACPHCGFNPKKDPVPSISEMFQSRKARIDAKTSGDGRSLFIRSLLKIGRFFWLMYMSLLVLIIYFIAFFSG